MFRLSRMRISTVAVGSALAVVGLAGAPVAQAAAPVSYATTTTAAASATAASMDWSGWDATAGSYRSVAAAWTVPAVTCTTGETSYSADWVGLDGDGSEAVEQIGTSSDCDSGTPVYSAWYEFYPSVSVSLPKTVRAGDRITASVAAVANSHDFTVTLTDSTAKWTVSRTQASPEGSGASAEIIAEAPSGSEQGDSVLPLADFTKVTFTDARIDGTGIGSVSDARSIAMVDGSGTPMATVSELGSNSFDVTWVSSGAAPAAYSTGGRDRGDTAGTGEGSTYPDGSTLPDAGGAGDGDGYGDGDTGTGTGTGSDHWGGWGDTGTGGWGGSSDTDGWGGFWQS